MSSKKRGKLKRCGTSGEELQPSPFELEVCKYLYRSLPSSEGRLGGCRVNYFSASSAVECLLQSKWADPLPKGRRHCSVYGETFGEAINRKVKRKGSGKEKEDEEEKKKSRTHRSAEWKSSRKKEVVQTEVDASALSEKWLAPTRSVTTKRSRSSVAKESSFMSYFVSCASSPSSTSTKRKKPTRLEYAVDQVFVLEDEVEGEGEGESVYVWIYEAPPNLITWLLGLALIAGVIACCAFPMWPWQARQGAYYVTLVALTLLGALLFLATLRALLCVLILLLSLGRMRLWLFPNLFADCGFFESFRPLYTLDRVTIPNPKLVTNIDGKE
ncbi:Translocation protein SEC62 [Taenia crassiceps]|uniref:Translocation protein SEC62 n=1 Tax=Taenia crassiceps TaxID=6207 RepID=A0ABR4Q4G8_9CEST